MLNYGESTSFSGRLCENLTGLASSQSGFGWCLSRIQSLDPFQLLGMLIISSLQLYPIRVCMVCKYLVRYTNKWSSTNDERLSDAPDEIELIWSCFMTLNHSVLALFYVNLFGKNTLSFDYFVVMISRRFPKDLLWNKVNFLNNRKR